LAPGKASYQLLYFPKNHKASLSVSFEADLFVYDEMGKVIARSGPKGSKLEWTPKDPANCLVKIVNATPTVQSGVFKHNLKPFESAKPSAAIKVAAGAKAAFYETVEPGKVALLDVESDGPPPFEVSVYNVAGAKIATDSKGRRVAADGHANQIIRVAISNAEKKTIVCDLKWTTHAIDAAALPAFDLEHGRKKEFSLSFEADKLAAIWVTSEKDTDVDLMVYDEKGKEVVSDIAIGKDCFVGWMPAKATTVRVVVVNHGVGANRCTLKHNGAITKK
jgi:hypothetical protein